METFNLNQRFNIFLDSIGCENIDKLSLNDVQQRANKADFFAKNRQFIIEIKSLNQDTDEKIGKAIDKHRNRPDFPIIFGSIHFSRVLRHFPVDDKIRKDVFNAVTSPIKEGFEQANRQIRETKKTFDLPASYGILIILNDCVDIFTPDLVMNKCKQLFEKRTPEGDVRFPDIDWVFMLNELYSIDSNTDIKLLPCLSLPSYKIHTNIPQSILDFINFVGKKWCEYNNIMFIEALDEINDPLSFSKIDKPF